MDQKIRLDLIEENNEFIFAKNLGREIYVILYPLNDSIKKTYMKYEKVEYFPFVQIENKSYEAIFFNEGLTESLTQKLFDIISNNGDDLRKNLISIGTIFNNLYKSVNKKFIIGAFAELKAITEFDLTPFNDENSVFDFRDNNGNDVEIKSFSPIGRKAIMSYQQIINNDRARVIFMEVIESSNGETLKELFEKLNPTFQKRYDWIHFLNDKSLEYRFNVGKIIETTSKTLSEGLNMPIKAKNANFIYNVDDFSQE